MLVAAVLMYVDHHYRHLAALRSTLAVFAYPLQVVAELPVSVSRSVSALFTERQSLRADNQVLREANLKLLARLQKLDALRAENLRLRDLLESSYKIDDQILVAELSAVDLDPYRQQVVIDKGSASRVFEGQPVLDALAVMGQVVHVNPFSATVLLITDASHALPVQVLRNGLRTIAVGTGQLDALRLPYLTNSADIQVGDRLVTSGLGGKFPPGYPVAEVVEVDRAPDQHFAGVRARPLAHLDRSREVLLVWTVDPLDGIPQPAEPPPAPAEPEEAAQP